MVGNIVQGNRLASAQGRDMGIIDEESDSARKVCFTTLLIVTSMCICYVIGTSNEPISPLYANTNFMYLVGGGIVESIHHSFCYVIVIYVVKKNCLSIILQFTYFQVILSFGMLK